MNHYSPVSRRRFLQRAAAFAGGAAGAQYLGMPAGLSAASPNAKLGVAVIGAGGMGGYSFSAGMGERLVAFCDVDEKVLASKSKEFAEKKKDQPAPKTYFDYRKLLDECHRDIDAVLIGTPDHHHAPAAMRAITRGLHVYVQKPTRRHRGLPRVNNSPPDFERTACPCNRWQLQVAHLEIWNRARMHRHLMV